MQLTLALILAIDLAGTLSGIWHRATRATSSPSATGQGMKAYAAKRYPAAESAFRQAYQLAPSPRTAYNLGTAQVAAGKSTEGSDTLGKAMAEQSLRADALYNRGNSALQSHAYDYAIRDYSEALRLRPSHLPTKRNLEIAQARKMEQEQSEKQQKKGGQSPSPQKPQPQPSPGKQQEQKKGQSDAESLLRSVQQQEQEELSRMKRARADRTRVGW